jgi:ABC-2 type transport system permease protein
LSDARILERGYRPYDGERLGLPSIVRSLVRHSAQRVLGLRRPARAKILPVLSAACAYLPAVVFIGIAAIVPESEFRDEFLPTYPEYYGFITSALVVFAVFVAPEALCSDRRNGLLGYYLAAPLTRLSYVTSKVIAVFTLLLLTTLGPPLLLMIAFMLQGIGPDGPLDVLVLLFRVVASGALVAILYTAVSLGVSSLTDRRAFASAGTLLVIIVSGVVTGALVNGASAPRSLLAGNLFVAPFALVFRIYGQSDVDLDQVSTVALVIGVAGWTLLGFGTLWFRYRRMEAK